MPTTVPAVELFSAETQDQELVPTEGDTGHNSAVIAAGDNIFAIDTGQNWEEVRCSWQ